MAETYIPKTHPMNSELFLPPASCKHKGGDEAFVREQNSDREKMVCAIGIDVHYELNVVSNETGAYAPRLKPFNPRISGPACPPNYTGKFVDEDVHQKFNDDPIALGREIRKQKPYDRTLYAARDPRLVSKTQVVRDYGCKIPIDLADTTKIAQAVLTHFPDQYVAFLGEFVSNMFGSAMKSFLDEYIKGYSLLLERPEELNRISWASYHAVQGGVSAEDSIGATDAQHVDHTLVWKRSLKDALNKLSDTGRPMTGQFSPGDVYNIRSCIQQHLETLKTMRDDWCRGFGSDEENVICMMYFCNEQGRQWGDDLRIISDQGKPDYDKILLHVPVNLMFAKSAGFNERIHNPDRNTSIRKNLIEETSEKHYTDTVVYPVGQWAGNGTNIFIDTTSVGNYSWGFGHCCNLLVRRNIMLDNSKGIAPLQEDSILHPDSKKRLIPDVSIITGGDRFHTLLTYPFLKYGITDDNAIYVEENPSLRSTGMSRTFVRTDKWGVALRPEKDNVHLDNVIDKATAIPTRALRASLEDNDPQHPLLSGPPSHFRGAGDSTFRSVGFAGPQTIAHATSTGGKSSIRTYYAPETEDGLNATRTTMVSKEDFDPRKDGQVLQRSDMVSTRSRDCDGTPGSFHVIESRHKRSEYLNPFLTAPGCFTADRDKEALMISTDAVAGYDFNTLSSLKDEVLKYTAVAPFSSSFSSTVASVCRKLKPLKPKKRTWALRHDTSNVVPNWPNFKKRYGSVQDEDCMGWKHTRVPGTHDVRTINGQGEGSIFGGSYEDGLLLNEKEGGADDQDRDFDKLEMGPFATINPGAFYCPTDNGLTHETATVQEVHAAIRAIGEVIQSEFGVPILKLQNLDTGATDGATHFNFYNNFGAMTPFVGENYFKIFADPERHLDATGEWQMKKRLGGGIPSLHGDFHLPLNVLKRTYHALDLSDWAVEDGHIFNDRDDLDIRHGYNFKETKQAIFRPGKHTGKGSDWEYVTYYNPPRPKYADRSVAGGKPDIYKPPLTGGPPGAKAINAIPNDEVNMNAFLNNWQNFRTSKADERFLTKMYPDVAIQTAKIAEDRITNSSSRNREKPDNWNPFHILSGSNGYLKFEDQMKALNYKGQDMMDATTVTTIPALSGELWGNKTLTNKARTILSYGQHRGKRRFKDADATHDMHPYHINGTVHEGLTTPDPNYKTLRSTIQNQGNTAGNLLVDGMGVVCNWSPWFFGRERDEVQFETIPCSAFINNDFKVGANRKDMLDGAVPGFTHGYYLDKMQLARPEDAFVNTADMRKTLCLAEHQAPRNFREQHLTQNPNLQSSVPSYQKMMENHGMEPTACRLRISLANAWGLQSTASYTTIPYHTYDKKGTTVNNYGCPRSIYVDRQNQGLVRDMRFNELKYGPSPEMNSSNFAASTSCYIPFNHAGIMHAKTQNLGAAQIATASGCFVHDYELAMREKSLEVASAVSTTARDAFEASMFPLYHYANHLQSPNMKMSAWEVFNRNHIHLVSKSKGYWMNTPQLDYEQANRQPDEQNAFPTQLGDEYFSQKDPLQILYAKPHPLETDASSVASAHPKGEDVAKYGGHAYTLIDYYGEWSGLYWRNKQAAQSGKLLNGQRERIQAGLASIKFSNPRTLITGEYKLKDWAAQLVAVPAGTTIGIKQRFRSNREYENNIISHNMHKYHFGEGHFWTPFHSVNPTGTGATNTSQKVAGFAYDTAANSANQFISEGVIRQVRYHQAGGNLTNDTLEVLFDVEPQEIDFYDVNCMYYRPYWMESLEYAKEIQGVVPIYLPSNSVQRNDLGASHTSFIENDADKDSWVDGYQYFGLDTAPPLRDMDYKDLPSAAKCLRVNRLDKREVDFNPETGHYGLGEGMLHQQQHAPFTAQPTAVDTQGVSSTEMERKLTYFFYYQHEFSSTFMTAGQSGAITELNPTGVDAKWFGGNGSQWWSSPSTDIVLQGADGGRDIIDLTQHHAHVHSMGTVVPRGAVPCSYPPFSAAEEEWKKKGKLTLLRLNYINFTDPKKKLTRGLPIVPDKDTAALSLEVRTNVGGGGTPGFPDTDYPEWERATRLDNFKKIETSERFPTYRAHWNHDHTKNYNKKKYREKVKPPIPMPLGGRHLCLRGAINTFMDLTALNHWWPCAGASAICPNGYEQNRFMTTFNTFPNNRMKDYRTDVDKKVNVDGTTASVSLEEHVFLHGRNEQYYPNHADFGKNENVRRDDSFETAFIHKEYGGDGRHASLIRSHPFINSTFYGNYKVDLQKDNVGTLQKIGRDLYPPTQFTIHQKANYNTEKVTSLALSNHDPTNSWISHPDVGGMATVYNNSVSTDINQHGEAHLTGRDDIPQVVMYDIESYQGNPPPQEVGFFDDKEYQEYSERMTDFFMGLLNDVPEYKPNGKLWPVADPHANSMDVDASHGHYYHAGTDEEEDAKLVGDLDDDASSDPNFIATTTTHDEAIRMGKYTPDERKNLDAHFGMMNGKYVKTTLYRGVTDTTPSDNTNMPNFTHTYYSGQFAPDHNIPVVKALVEDPREQAKKKDRGIGNWPARTSYLAKLAPIHMRLGVPYNGKYKVPRSDVNMYVALFVWASNPKRTFSPGDCMTVLNTKFFQDNLLEPMRMSTANKALYAPSKFKLRFSVPGLEGKFPIRLMLPNKLAGYGGEYFSAMSGLSQAIDVQNMTRNLNLVDASSLSSQPKEHVSVLFPEMTPSQALQTQIMILRESFSASLGMYVAAAICETTFMNDHYMASLRHATQCEYPGTDPNRIHIVNGMFTESEELYPHTGLKFKQGEVQASEMLKSLNVRFDTYCRSAFRPEQQRNTGMTVVHHRASKGVQGRLTEYFNDFLCKQGYESKQNTSEFYIHCMKYIDKASKKSKQDPGYGNLEGYKFITLPSVGTIYESLDPADAGGEMFKNRDVDGGFTADDKEKIGMQCWESVGVLLDLEEYIKEYLTTSAWDRIRKKKPGNDAGYSTYCGDITFNPDSYTPKFRKYAKSAIQLWIYRQQQIFINRVLDAYVPKKTRRVTLFKDNTELDAETAKYELLSALKTNILHNYQKFRTGQGLQELLNKFQSLVEGHFWCGTTSMGSALLTSYGRRFITGIQDDRQREAYKRFPIELMLIGKPSAFARDGNNDPIKRKSKLRQQWEDGNVDVSGMDIVLPYAADLSDYLEQKRAMVESVGASDFKTIQADWVRRFTGNAVDRFGEPIAKHALYMEADSTPAPKFRNYISALFNERNPSTSISTVVEGLQDTKRRPYGGRTTTSSIPKFRGTESGDDTYRAATASSSGPDVAREYITFTPLAPNGAKDPRMTSTRYNNPRIVEFSPATPNNFRHINENGEAGPPRPGSLRLNNSMNTFFHLNQSRIPSGTNMAEEPDLMTDYYWLKIASQLHLNHKPLTDSKTFMFTEKHFETVFSFENCFPCLSQQALVRKTTADGTMPRGHNADRAGYEGKTTFNLLANKVDNIIKDLGNDIHISYYFHHSVSEPDSALGRMTAFFDQHRATGGGDEPLRVKQLDKHISAALFDQIKGAKNVSLSMVAGLLRGLGVCLTGENGAPIERHNTAPGTQDRIDLDEHVLGFEKNFFSRVMNVFPSSHIAHHMFLVGGNPFHPTKFNTDSGRRGYAMRFVESVNRQLKAGVPIGKISYPMPEAEQHKNLHFVPLQQGVHNMDTSRNMLFNDDFKRPQLFSMFDAAAILFNAKEYFNPSSTNRPGVAPELGSIDDMHYWCRYLTESFLVARQNFRSEAGKSHRTYETEVKVDPESCFPTRLIGAMSDDTFHKYFPLLPKTSMLKDNLRRVRSLAIMWGQTPGYRVSDTQSAAGAWMPLSVFHQHQLLDSVGLFDHKHKIPRNPWASRNRSGLLSVYNQSYHSCYYTDSYKAAHFDEWVKHACRYQPPRFGDNTYYPFSQYGGTPVQADFIQHCVEFPTSESSNRHRQMVYNRFGMTAPLRLGQQFHDKGMLQDMFQSSYRPFANLSREQRAMQQPAKEVWMSNFMAYCRTHAVIAIASCNHGTEEASVPRIVRNLYRMYVDTYECMGHSPDDDSVPAILGFLPTPIANSREDRPVTLFAGSLTCLNTKLERFCNSDANRGEKVCANYKQTYLNESAMLFNRLLRQKRKDLLHYNNFLRAQIKRGANFTRDMFNEELIRLQDSYIEFLQQTVLGMLIESGANLGGLPLNLLEPRELEVSLMDEDDNVVGNDYLTPRTQEIIKEMDFAGDTLNRTQLAILSLIPPNNRILATLKLDQKTEIVDLEHARKRIQEETIQSNKKAWERYSEALVSAAFGQKYLEFGGPIDLSFDFSSIKDPLQEAENIKTKMTSTFQQKASSLSQHQRNNQLRSNVGGDYSQSVLGMNTAELNRALQAVRDRVERDYAREDGSRTRAQCLAALRVPEHIKRMLRDEYA